MQIAHSKNVTSTLRLRGAGIAVALVFIAAAAAARPASALQASGTTSDSGRARQLRTVVVTAERVRTSLGSSTSAVSVISGTELRRRPVKTLAEALQQTPGLAFVDFDGSGGDPQLMVRGFYGGGEAEYVLLLVDGQPVNAHETGRVTWDLIPLDAVDAVEIVRGGASAAWGDAALGGVINVITKRGRTGHPFSVSIIGGQQDLIRASGSASDRWNNRPLSAFGNYWRQNGYREHAERTTGSAGGSIGLLGDEGQRSLSLSTLNDWRGYDEPGPLSGTDLAASRSGSAPFYRFDHTSEHLHRVGLDGQALGKRMQVTANLAGEYRSSDRIRTAPLSPTFADTKNRLLDVGRVLGSAQMETNGLASSADNLLLGADASIGQAHSKYYDMIQGPRAAYAAANPTRGALAASGVGSRAAAAAFARYGIEPTASIRFSLEGRLDWLRDHFDVREPGTTGDTSTTHVAFSPKAGVSWRYTASPSHEGHLYANVGRSFKAPTPDQLFDQRSVPVPFPPFRITFSNPTLHPQYGTSYEIGSYQHAAVVRDVVDADFNFAAYQIDLRDELDFDIATLRYQNIGRSRHRGLEAGLRLEGPRSLSVHGNYTLQAPISQSGSDNVKSLKAIPRHFVVAGADIGRGFGPAIGINVTTARRIWLDDANTRQLPGWTRWDARASVGAAGLGVFADVLNLFDAKYSTTGFPDPSGTTAVYYYPAAGRTVQVGIRVGGRE